MLYLSLVRLVFTTAREPFSLRQGYVGQDGRGWGADAESFLFSPKTPSSSVAVVNIHFFPISLVYIVDWYSIRIDGGQGCMSLTDQLIRIDRTKKAARVSRLSYLNWLRLFARWWGFHSFGHGNGDEGRCCHFVFNE